VNNRIVAKMSDLNSKGGKSLSVVLMIGDPTLTKTIENIQLAIDAGVDIIELGIPISAPFLDSQIMHDSMNRALNYSNDLSSYLSALQLIRNKFPSIPFEVMVYHDTVMEVGFERFFDGLNDAEMDAVLVADGIFQGQEFLKRLDKKLRLTNCIPIRFVPHPFNPEQLLDLKANGKGFIVIQTKPDMDGKRNNVTPDNKENLEVIRTYGVTTPLVMAYGIKNPFDIKECIKLGADGVLIGSIVLEAANKLSSNDLFLLLRDFRSAAT